MTMFFVDRKSTLMLPETNTTYFKDLCSCGNDFFFFLWWLKSLLEIIPCLKYGLWVKDFDAKTEWMLWIALQLRESYIAELNL